MLLRLFGEMAADEHAVAVRIGRENAAFGLGETSIVSSAFDDSGARHLATGHRRPDPHGLLEQHGRGTRRGPLPLPHARRELTQPPVATDRHPAIERTSPRGRPLRGPRRLTRRDPRRDQEGVPSPGPRTPPRRESRRRGIRALQRGSPTPTTCSPIPKQRQQYDLGGGQAGFGGGSGLRRVRRHLRDVLRSRAADARGPRSRRERGQDALIRVEVGLDEVDLRHPSRHRGRHRGAMRDLPGLVLPARHLAGDLRHLPRNRLRSSASVRIAARQRHDLEPVRHLPRLRHRSSRTPCVTCQGQGRVRAAPHGAGRHPRRRRHGRAPADAGQRRGRPRRRPERRPLPRDQGQAPRGVQPQRRRPARDARGADDRRDARHDGDDPRRSTATSRSRCARARRAPRSSP